VQTDKRYIADRYYAGQAINNKLYMVERAFDTIQQGFDSMNEEDRPFDQSFIDEEKKRYAKVAGFAKNPLTEKAAVANGIDPNDVDAYSKFVAISIAADDRTSEAIDQYNEQEKEVKRFTEMFESVGSPNEEYS